MARKRMMHLDMFSNPGFLRLSVDAQKLWVFLILDTDDFGRVRLDPFRLKAQCFPFDQVSLDEIEAMISDLEKHMSFRTYESDGEKYGIFIHYLSFQVLDRPQSSRLPAPPSEILEQLYLPRNKDGGYAGWVSDLLKMGYAGQSHVPTDSGLYPDKPVAFTAPAPKVKRAIEIDYQTWVDTYNTNCPNLPQVSKLTDKRRRAIKAAAAEFVIVDFETICKFANNDAWCKGEKTSANHGNWVATFDYLIRIDTITSMLEKANSGTKKLGVKKDEYF